MITKQNVIIQCKDLIEELNLDYLSEEKQEELIDEMSEVVYDRIILRILAMMTEEDVIKITKLIESGAEFEAGEILTHKIPNFENVLKREFLDFQHEIIESIK
ncbi:MAG TPA: DUF5663 domain-containing protein [Candidatus Pacearchaeota archaeon]|nr:hypothetical protein [Candidatus Parcubacteria bacterium]HNP79223.1 DUF5663 domain-containing protein [Candidatus Pacearchaeota archaeon]HOC53477.1 DUF5663 domain-containing protein [Candidatus Pacearchaeota archaeon]HQM24856.1 DUF5663 domain-containing protein [Candidatus Pacearchaeota archaeon]